MKIAADICVYTNHNLIIEKNRGVICQELCVLIFLVNL